MHREEKKLGGGRNLEVYVVSAPPGRARSEIFKGNFAGRRRVGTWKTGVVDVNLSL